MKPGPLAARCHSSLTEELELRRRTSSLQRTESTTALRGMQQKRTPSIVVLVTYPVIHPYLARIPGPICQELLPSQHMLTMWRHLRKILANFFISDHETERWLRSKQSMPREGIAAAHVRRIFLADNFHESHSDLHVKTQPCLPTSTGPDKSQNPRPRHSV